MNFQESQTMLMEVHGSKMKETINELLTELLNKHEIRNNYDRYCCNCGSYANTQYSRYIFWNKYEFCGEWCSFDTESEMRKSYRRQ